MKRLIASFASNTVFANIVLVIILLAGILAAGSMVRETFPQFSLDMIQITVPYPGADPEEVEEGISRKIEEAIESLEGIKQYTTTSMEDAGTAFLEVKEGYDVDEVLDRVRSKIDAISTFPVDAEKPIVAEMLIRNEVVFLALSGRLDERRLKEWTEKVKDDIQQLPEVSQVEGFGLREYEIAIEVSEERLREYGLTFAQVAGAVRQSNLNLAGGTIRTRGEEIRVRTMGRKYTGKELSSIVVLARPEGEIITLDRLATIRDGFSEDPIYLALDGERASMLIVYKTEEEDSLAIAKAVHAYVEEQQERLPEGANMKILIDLSEMLRARIDLLTKNGVIGLCLVFFLLWVFLDFRLSFWAGMGMPISVAGALAIMWGIGATINMISLFGLIMVIGIVVDDAIVVGEAIFFHRKRGEPPLKAVVEGVREVGLPVLAAVTTTIVAFLPLAYVGGIMGKFIQILPVVVIACLLISLVECLILLPAHLNNLPDPNVENHVRNPIARRIERFHQWTSRGLEWFVAKVYAPFLRKTLYWRYISFSVAVSILLVTLGLLRGGILKFIVFPDIDGFVMTATVEFPGGTPPEVTRQALLQMEAAAKRLNETTPTTSGEPLLKNLYYLVGSSLQEIPVIGPHVGSVQCVLLESEKRGIHTDDLMVRWEEEIGPIPGIVALTIEGIGGGPPGAPIEIWIQGREMDRILAAGGELKSRLRQFEGVYQVRSDFVPGKNEMRLELKPEARAMGITVGDLAGQVYAGYYGEEALRLQRGRDDIRVKVRYTEDERRRISELERIRIRTPRGHEVPLLSVADVRFTAGYSTITRTDGYRRVAVSAEVDSNRANANEIIEELSRTYFSPLEERYRGLKVSVQGEKKKMRESFGSLFVGFPLAMFGMFMIIATMFRSYAQPFVILFTVPFGFIGATWGHLLLGKNLSMMSIFGMVALAGVVVNDAIVMIERINENHAEGMSFFQAIQQGGARRFRAVFLTTISTVGGLTPLIMETDFQAQIVIPMAISLAAGVAFATTLTLVLVPSMLVILNDLRRLTHRMRHGTWPTREEVEPARTRKMDPLKEPQALPSPATSWH
jgi:multidrug efflux pump subunit AcrB